MQRLLLILALVAMTAGCSKKDAASDSATAAADAASAAAVAASAAADASAAAVSAATSAATAAASPADSAAAAAASPAPAGSGSAATIDLPIYPGAVKDDKTSMSVTSGTGSVKLDVYTSKDASATVAAWYKSHVPANWQNVQMDSNGKTSATFATPEHTGDDDQSIIVTAADDGSTRIQMTTKTGH